jgi:long-chain fatty acid transport protein
MTMKRYILLAAALLLAFAAVPGHATNGMYLISYGAETGGRAGANIAVADRTLALNFNPAGLTQLQGQHYSLNLSVLAPQLKFENGLNHETDAEDRYFPLPAFAYVRSRPASKWSWGLGFVGQGGMGATFENLNTPFGTRDETFSEVRFGTLTPTVAYALSPDMALGAAFNLGYADASFRFFPHTSFFNTQDPANSFFGPSMKRAGGLQTSARVGWWWRANQQLSFGAIYQTETKSKFENGDLSVNFTGHPFLQRKVNYDATMDGFTFAAQAGAGVAFRPAPDWVLALDVKRYFWDHAIDTVTVKGTHPDVQGAPSEVILPFVFNWRDQWVYALGADWRVSPGLTLRAGYNYGENPVPNATLTPLFPATVEQHLTLGAGWLRGNTTYDFAIERALNKSVVNDDTDPRVNPFGPGARVDHSQWTVSFGVSWATDL